MPTCPRCSAEINKLLVVDEKHGVLASGEDGKLQAIDYSEYSVQSFSCPKCGDEIYTLRNRPDLATKFLKTSKMF